MTSPKISTKAASGSRKKGIRVKAITEDEPPLDNVKPEGPRLRPRKRVSFEEDNNDPVQDDPSFQPRKEEKRGRRHDMCKEDGCPKWRKSGCGGYCREHGEEHESEKQSDQDEKEEADEEEKTTKKKRPKCEVPGCTNQSRGRRRCRKHSIGSATQHSGGRKKRKLSETEKKEEQPPSKRARITKRLEERRSRDNQPSSTTVFYCDPSGKVEPETQEIKTVLEQEKQERIQLTITPMQDMARMLANPATLPPSAPAQARAAWIETLDKARRILLESVTMEIQQQASAL